MMSPMNGRHPMAVEQGIGTGLATLAQALRHRRAGLLAELREIEEDLAAVARSAAAADRLGGGDDDDDGDAVLSCGRAPISSAHPAESARTRGSTGQSRNTNPFSAPPCHPARANDDGPVCVQKGMHVPGKAIPQRPGDYELRQAALSTLGPVRNDAALPPRSERGERMTAKDIPSAQALPALHDSVQGISRRAARLPPGPGGHGRYSTRGILNGEPLAPQLRNILKAADRPLTSKEVAIALSQMRNLELRGRLLAAVVKRVGAILAQDVKPNRMA